MSNFHKVRADGAITNDLPNGHVAVIDSRTGLMWSANDISDERLTFEEAGKACAELNLAGATDWRLPTVEELFLLADRSKFNPSIDTDAFPACKSSWYWSSTVDASSPSGYAWGVNFGYGVANYNGQDSSGRVRAVRSVAPSASGQ